MHDDKEQLIQTLYAQIGELKVANDFLKKGVVKPLSERRLLIAPEHKTSLEYLVGNADLLLDSSVLQRIMYIYKLNDEDKTYELKLLEFFLRDTKARKAYA